MPASRSVQSTCTTRSSTPNLVAPWSGSKSLPSILTENQFIDLRASSQDPTAGEDKGFARLWEGFRVAWIEPAAARKWDPTKSPYPGLASFNEEQADIFFGRDKEIREGVELLSRNIFRVDQVVDPSVT